MLRFKVEAIRYERNGITLELHEDQPVSAVAGQETALFRCSGPTQGPNFTLRFRTDDPLYEQAAQLRIGASFELVSNAS